MSPLQLFLSFFAGFYFNRTPPTILELSNDQQQKYDDLLALHEGSFLGQVVGFRKETERLAELLCYWAAKGSGGMLIISGDKVNVKSKLIHITKEIWTEMNNPNVIPQRTLNMDRYTSERDLSMVSNRIIKEGILHMKNVDPNTAFFAPVFTKIESLVKTGKLMCIVELIPKETKARTKLYGLSVSDCVNFAKPDIREIESKIQEKWVETARENGLSTRMSDQELLKAAGCVAQDCTIEKLEDVMVYMTEMHQNLESSKKRKTEVDSAPSPPSSSNVTMSNCGNKNSTISDSNNAKSNNNTKDSNNDTESNNDTDSNNAGHSNHSGNTTVLPAARDVSVGNIEQDFARKLPEDYLPLRSQTFELPADCKKKGKISMGDVVNFVSKVPPEAADIIPNAPARTFVKSALQVAANTDAKKRKRDDESKA